MIRSILAVLAGYLTMAIGVTTMFAFIMFVAFGGMPDRADFQPPAWLLWLELASTPVLAVLGGYVCAWVAREQQLRHAVALAGLILALGGASAMLEWGKKPLIATLAVPPLGVLGALVGTQLRLLYERS